MFPFAVALFFFFFEISFHLQSSIDIYKSFLDIICCIVKVGRDARTEQIYGFNFIMKRLIINLCQNYRA